MSNPEDNSESGYNACIIRDGQGNMPFYSIGFLTNYSLDQSKPNIVNWGVCHFASHPTFYEGSPPLGVYSTPVILCKQPSCTPLALID